MVLLAALCGLAGCSSAATATPSVPDYVKQGNLSACANLNDAIDAANKIQTSQFLELGAEQARSSAMLAGRAANLASGDLAATINQVARDFAGMGDKLGSATLQSSSVGTMIDLSTDMATASRDVQAASTLCQQNGLVVPLHYLN